jgi:hypothetical protein
MNNGVQSLVALDANRLFLVDLGEFIPELIEQLAHLLRAEMPRDVRIHPSVRKERGNRTFNKMSLTCNAQ